MGVSGLTGLKALGSGGTGGPLRLRRIVAVSTLVLGAAFGSLVVAGPAAATGGTPAVTAVTPGSGAGGSGAKVVIAGSNFTGATSVTFNGTPAVSFAAKATSIKAIAPAGSAGTVDVVVTTPGGVSTMTPADHYTYQLPAISSVTPTSGPGAGGKAVVISGADFNGTTAVHFGGTLATSIIVKPTAIKAVVPPGVAGTVYVLVTTPAGTNAPGPADQYTYLGPSVTSVSPASGPGVGGTKVTISGTGFTGATAVHFGSVPSTNFTVKPTTIVAYSPAVSGSLVKDITVTTPGGTSPTSSPADRFTYTSGNGTPVDASNYAVTCTGVTGTVGLDPPISLSGGTTSGTETYTITAALSGCTAIPTLGGPPVVVHGGSVSGTLTDQNGNSCINLAETGDNLNLQGSVQIGWNTTPSLSSGDSVLNVNSAEFSVGSSSNPLSFQMPSDIPDSVTGSFTAGNGGADTIANITSADTLGQLFAGCDAGGGLASLPVNGGVFDLGAPPSSVSLVVGSTGLAAGYALGGVSINALGQFGSETVDLSQVATWSSSDPSIAAQASCGTTSITYPPTCFDFAAAGPVTLSASWMGVMASTALTAVDLLTLNYPGTLPDGTLGTAYDLPLSISGGVGPYTVSATGLPQGLSIDNSTSPPSIVGTPVVGGDWEPDVTVSDVSGQTAGGFYLMNVDCSTVCLSPTSLPSGTVGTPYDQTIVASGGTAPYTYTAAYGLPSGWNLNPATGELTGTPASSGVINLVVEVTDSADPSNSVYWLYNIEAS